MSLCPVVPNTLARGGTIATVAANLIGSVNSVITHAMTRVPISGCAFTYSGNVVNPKLFETKSHTYILVILYSVARENTFVVAVAAFKPKLAALNMSWSNAKYKPPKVRPYNPK